MGAVGWLPGRPRRAVGGSGADVDEHDPARVVAVVDSLKRGAEFGLSEPDGAALNREIVIAIANGGVFEHVVHGGDRDAAARAVGGLGW